MVQLKVGKYYVTRSGEKVGPMTEDKFNNYPFSVENRCHKNWKWTENGRYYLNEESPDDLVEEWIITHPSPVQEVITKQLVAGHYGIVTVYKVSGVTWRYELTKSTGTPDELRQAAATLTKIADFLEEQGQ